MSAYFFHSARIAIAIGGALIALWVPGSVALMVWVKKPPETLPAVWLAVAIMIAAAFGALAGALALIGWAS